MEAISAYFLSHPAAFTLLVVFVVIMILYFILSKFIKLTIIFLIIIFLTGGVYLFKDPAAMSGKIKQTVETLKIGGEEIGDKLSDFWRDTKDLAGKAKEVPGDLNKMLDTADKDVKKQLKK